MEKSGLLTMEKESNIMLFSLKEAEGTIEAAEQTPEVVKQAEAIVSGEYHTQISGDVICKCIDGRKSKLCLEGPNSAGGTLSLLIADDLVSQRYITSDEPIAAGMQRMATMLNTQGTPVGVHADSQASGEKSGCGANDRLPEIYAMMVKKAENIRLLAESILGSPIDDEIHNLIMSRALDRTVFSNGADVHAAAVNEAGEESSETLEGTHQEIVAVVNLVPFTTLDRDSLEQTSDGSYQAFNIDAWAFEPSIRAISEHDDNDINAKVIALTYYNLATALVLCGSKMLVGVRK